MKFAKKMKLVPFDGLPDVKPVEVRPVEPAYDRDPLQQAVENVHQDMQHVLNDPTLTDEKIMQRYGQLLHRYQTMQRKRKQVVPLLDENIPEPREEENSEAPILESVPRPYQHRARLLLKHMKEKTPWSWNENLELVRNGVPVPYTNAIDIVNDLVRRRKNTQAPVGWFGVMQSLKATNAPREAIGNQERWNVLSTPPTRTPPRRPRKKKISSTDTPSIPTRRWLSLQKL
ncbi:hypothetical protein SNE40_018222 [Patella caerulea]|uniref:Uncharacterized protein n=1 Tax=Patella caerulea TaxID=87958 RepID=A0AAN8P6T2_PATCE